MELIKLPSGRIINMARVTEVVDGRFGATFAEDQEGPTLRILFGQRDGTSLRGADRAALLRYVGHVARDLGAEEDRDLGRTRDREHAFGQPDNGRPF